VSFLIDVVCNDNNDYELKSWENDYICFKAYFRGKKSTLYSTAANQCQNDNGRLIIMDKIWKANVVIDFLMKSKFNIITYVHLNKIKKEYLTKLGNINHNKSAKSKIPAYF